MSIDRVVAWTAVGCAVFATTYFVTSTVLMLQWREPSHRPSGSAIALSM